MNRAANSGIVVAALIVSGSIGAAIGALILWNPVEFHAMAGIALGRDASLLNEMRAAGGGILVCGLFIVAGAFRPELAFGSLTLAALLYLANGVSRIFGMAIDGLPSDVLMLVAAAEISIGLGCAYILSRFWR